MTERRHVRWHWPHLLLLAGIPLMTATTQRLQWSTSSALFGWLVFNLAVLALAERWRPFRPEWQATPRHVRRDGAIGVLNLATDAAASAALTALVVAYLPGHSTWPMAVQIVVGLLVAEFGAYWMHRWSHSGHWLWRVHLLHHRPDRLNVANAITAHPINAVYDKLVRTLPLLALGLAPEAMVGIALFGLTQTLAVHANVAGSIGPLNRLVGSAELHRLHHSARAEEAGNYGTALPLWDQVFGTYRRGEAPTRIGVFEPSRYPSEWQIGALLAWPFLKILPCQGSACVPRCCRASRPA